MSTRKNKPSRARATVEIVTARIVKGSKWASQYPDKADELWVIAHVAGRKKKKHIGPPTPENRRCAERKRDEWRAALNLKLGGLSDVIAPTFKEIGEAFIERGLTNRAWKTQDSRRYQTNALIQHFDQLRIDQIAGPELTRLWSTFLMGEKKLDVRTGGFYLDCASLIFKFAVKEGHDVPNPVPDHKAAIMEDARNTAEYRSRDESNKNPLSVDEMRKFLPQLDSCEPNFMVWCLLMYEAGLRKSEAFGLQWGDIWPGKDDHDTQRHLHVQRSRREGRVGLTKSGRTRKVRLSQRLRRVLLERRMQLGRPADDEFVVRSVSLKRYSEELRRICKAARIDNHTAKDFRDTFATMLLTNGIPLKWISNQLGHGSVAVTERHYARWMDEDEYRNPWQVAEGQVPQDLFAEGDLRRAPKTPLHAPKENKTK
jgi:integrase